MMMMIYMIYISRPQAPAAGAFRQIVGQVPGAICINAMPRSERPRYSPATGHAITWNQALAELLTPCGSAGYSVCELVTQCVI